MTAAMACGGVSPAAAREPVSATERQLAVASATAVQDLIVTGSKVAAEAVGGSAVYLDQQALETFSYSDVNRTLRQVARARQIGDAFAILDLGRSLRRGS